MPRCVRMSVSWHNLFLDFSLLFFSLGKNISPVGKKSFADRFDSIKKMYLCGSIIISYIFYGARHSYGHITY